MPVVRLLLRWSEKVDCCGFCSCSCDAGHVLQRAGVDDGLKSYVSANMGQININHQLRAGGATVQSQRGLPREQQGAVRDETHRGAHPLYTALGTDGVATFNSIALTPPETAVGAGERPACRSYRGLGRA